MTIYGMRNHVSGVHLTVEQKSMRAVSSYG